MSDHESITLIINLCWDATNGSKVGPILSMNQDTPQINNIGLQTFYTILSNILPKNIQSYSVEPQEPWKS